LSNSALYGITRDPFAGVTALAPTIVRMAVADRMVVADGVIAGACLVLWFGFGTHSHPSEALWVLLQKNKNHQSRPPTNVQQPSLGVKS